MNSCTLLVKLLSPPYQIYLSDTISVVQVLVQFTDSRRREYCDEFSALFWGSLGTTFMAYYLEGDYVIIEGYFYFDKIKIKERMEKNTQFTVLKIFPFILVDD